jgi:hypothetical protein
MKKSIVRFVLLRALYTGSVFLALAATALPARGQNISLQADLFYTNGQQSHFATKQKTDFIGSAIVTTTDMLPVGVPGTFNPDSGSESKLEVAGGNPSSTASFTATHHGLVSFQPTESDLNSTSFSAGSSATFTVQSTGDGPVAVVTTVMHTAQILDPTGNGFLGSATIESGGNITAVAGGDPVFQFSGGANFDSARTQSVITTDGYDSENFSVSFDTQSNQFAASFTQSFTQMLEPNMTYQFENSSSGGFTASGIVSSDNAPVGIASLESVVYQVSVLDPVNSSIAVIVPEPSSVILFMTASLILFRCRTSTRRCLA